MRKKGWDVNKSCYRLLVWSGMRFAWQATRKAKTVWQQMEVGRGTIRGSDFLVGTPMPEF